MHTRLFDVFIVVFVLFSSIIPSDALSTVTHTSGQQCCAHDKTTTMPVIVQDAHRVFTGATERAWLEGEGSVWYQDVHIGKGKVLQNGVAVYMHFKGYLRDGTLFENTFAQRDCFLFTYGKGQVIKGLEYGIMGMREGGKRRICIPPERAYGSEGFKDDETTIPPDSPLFFEVSLLWIREPEFDKLRMFK